MASLFGCYPQKVQKVCMLKGVGSCGENVSHLICNRHAEIFGVTYATASYQNGNNDTWSKINMYITSPTSLNIPTFIDNRGAIKASEIRTFSINASNQHNVDPVKLQEILACLLGVNMYDNDSSCYGGWINELNSGIIKRQSDSEIEYAYDVPQFHKNLFYYSQPSFVMNMANDIQTYSIPNLSLTYNSESNSYAFTVLNKANILKKTNMPDCIATPIVLDAVRIMSHEPQERTFIPFPVPNPTACF